MLGANEDNFIIDDLAGVGDGYGSTRAVGSHEISRVYLRAKTPASVTKRYQFIKTKNTNTCNEIQETNNFVCCPYYWQVRYFSYVRSILFSLRNVI
jgi:hypothetical protein